ncbi:MAG: tetratricopeptide repeat protein [Phycisphaerales bacterium]|nr:tetratricopeptide repeat protein [Phycisphaerales bacterium]
MSNIESVLRSAGALESAGQRDRAIATLQQLAARNPKQPAAAEALARALFRAGRHEQALYYARRAVDLDPGNAARLTALALVLQQAGQLDETVAVLRKQLTLAPGIAGAWCNLGSIERARGDFAASCAAFERAIALDPKLPYVYTHAALLLEIGRHEEAEALLRRGTEECPGSAVVAHLWASLCNYFPGVNPGEAADAHRRYGRFYPRPEVAFPNSPDPDRLLRIGVLSADLRTHSVAYFLEPWLTHRGRDAAHLTIFSQTAFPDATTARLRALADDWAAAEGLDQAGLVEEVRRRRIDVLIELGGHTGPTRLGALAQRPAPVQVTYLGYPNTTGLPSMDYRIVDSLTDPPKADGWNTERLVRLDPCFLCYQPPSGAPEPALPSGPITFGSFNTIKKINAACAALWARVLHAVPGSRLVLKSGGGEPPGAFAAAGARLAQRGISPDRVEFLAKTEGAAQHLALYSRVHVALDTTPYNGTTTTCEALWMGVPVVALAGRSHPGRVGVSLLSAAGVPELVAANDDTFVSAAAALALDAPRLGVLRSTLRDRLRTSPLCDGPAFSRRFDAAVRGMWRERCGVPTCSPVPAGD